MAVALSPGILEPFYDTLVEKVWAKLPKALVVGQPPANLLGFCSADCPPYDGVIFGQISLGQLLHFTHEVALECLLTGKPVYIFEPGIAFPREIENQVLYRQLLAGREKLEHWGVVFYGGTQRFFPEKRLAFYQRYGLPLPQRPIIL